MKITNSSLGQLPSSLTLKKSRKSTMKMMTMKNAILRDGKSPKVAIGKAA
jgi:hypothetical protein